MRLIEKVIPPSSGRHTGTVIFFHGSGDTGNNLVEWIRFLLGKDMDFPHLKIIFPTAPVQPYTPLGGQNSNVWFDRRSISIDAKESRSSLAAIYETVQEILKREIGEGISPHRIIVGGFSMGGALALHTGYHLFLNQQQLGGIFACSSFLNRTSIVYESLSTASSDTKLPKLLMFHGDRDTLVPLKWGETTFQELRNSGVSGDFITLKNTLHELKKRQILQLCDWIQEIVPENENKPANSDDNIKTKL
uniref:palmitoyl-protein hydrolase n=1 Tax=Corethrella appendiculata TaxID=1370023 RepID=U5EXF5_9DIPT